MLGLGVLAALLGVFFFSIGDTLSKKASQSLGNVKSAMIVIGAGIIPLGISLFFVSPNYLDLNVLFLALLAGGLTAIGFVLVFKSLQTEQVTNTMTLVNIQYATIILFGILFLSQGINSIESLSLVLIFVGAFLVSADSNFKLNIRLVPAAIGMLFWGLDVVVVVYALSIYQTSTMLFFFARLSGSLFLLLYLLYLFAAGRKGASYRKQNYSLAISAGIFDGLALIAITFMGLLNTVTVGGAILALEPILIASYGYLFYKDKLTSMQSLGIALAVLGGVLLNIL